MMMMAEILPEMTVRQAHDLAVRILKQYTYEPSIAQILEEWRVMQRATRKDVLPSYTPKPVHPRQISRLKQAKESLRAGKNAEGVAVTPELIAFARTCFPHISLERIEANRIEISNCKTDREQDRILNRQYMTNMRLDDQGLITLYMSPMRW